MTKQEVFANCKWCNSKLSPRHLGPCPVCGKDGKKIEAHFYETYSISDSLDLEKRRTFYKKHKMANFINLVITFGSPFLGLIIDGKDGVIIGLILGTISFVIGPYSSSKIIEIIKFKDNR